MGPHGVDEVGHLLGVQDALAGLDDLLEVRLARLGAERPPGGELHQSHAAIPSVLRP